MNKGELADFFQNAKWYHTFDFEALNSNGTYDFRKIIESFPFQSLRGKSVLDVGCSDGFFSWYFKKHLHAKSVLGLDSNLYDGESAIAHMLSDDKVYTEKYQASNDFDRFKGVYEYYDLKDSNKFKFIAKLYQLEMGFQNGSIYDMSELPKFDFVFCGSLIEHLRDPITAVEQLYKKTNEVCIIDLSSPLPRIFNWNRFPIIRYMNSGGCFYNFSDVAFKKLALKCGFKSVEISYRYKLYNKKVKRMTPHTVFTCKV